MDKNMSAETEQAQPAAGGDSRGGSSRTDGNSRTSGFRITIYARILIVIIAIAVAIILFGNTVGAMFLTHSISKALEDDMLIAVDIADQYVTKEIELLKIKAAEAAKEISLSYKAGQTEGVLQRVCEEQPQYIGMAVFSENALLDSWGNSSVPPELASESFMQAARSGTGAVSNTMYDSAGALVMYVSAPIDGNLVLAAVLPGMYFCDLLSRLIFWQTGHLFINDDDGYVISNPRPEWVRQRYNFFAMAEEDSVFEGLAAMTRRGVSGERGTARYSINGVPRLCAFRPVSSPNENWFVAIVAPRPESALKIIPSGILLIGIITLALSIIAAVFCAAFLRRPYEEVDRLRKAAEAVSMSKSTFLANMSHEIRTPMNSIVGFSELALDGETSPKNRDYISKIQTNAQWLLQIINDILDISKVESGKLEIENIPFDLHELFSSCRTLIMPKAVEKGITLYFYVEPSIGKRPLGDPTRLRQVLVNLLSNAVKFTNTGMVKLHAALKDMSENSITMYFEIKDSGIGMSAQQIDRIFDSFTQAESGTTRRYGGTGLGLSITKNIIELMGGKLSVESTPGIGSKFSFELTFDTIDVSNDELFEKKVVLNELEKPTFEGEILLCEDNAMNQQVICEHLARVGLKTVVAGNGKIGLDMVQNRIRKGEKMFDLIFMDMHMPVMDGLEASARIKELKTGVPIVAMTANIMSNDREIYRMSGMRDCVGKPFTSQELWRCLMKYLTPVSMGTGEKNTKIESDIEFQRSLQLLFVKGNQKKYEEIINALKAGDIELAHRLAHTLKSNAGQIGKILLQKAAAEVEQRLSKGNNTVTEEQLELLESELNMVLNEFSILLKEEAAAKSEEAAVAAIEPEKARELLQKLEPLLKSGNPESLNFIKNLRAVPGSGQLIQQIEDFEFEAALRTLTGLKGGMG
jgi:signal transduction histidine kinase/DNA-binding response OmpR family regulator